MKKIPYFLVLAIGIVFTACQTTPEDENERPVFTLEQADQIDQENYDIYSLVINDFFNVDSLVIRQHSSTSIDLSESYFRDRLKENHPNIDSTLVDELVNINATSVLFDDKFTSDDKLLILVSNEELAYLFNSDSPDLGWPNFYDTYQNFDGILSFTRIAFSEDNTQALFEFSRVYGSLGGDGYVAYLEKVDGEWTIKEIFQTWIS